MPARPRMMPPVGKSGPGNDADQLVDAEPRIVDQRDAGIDHLAEIVRRDVGRHADRDAAGAVDQQVREARRQHHRLFLVAVVVRLEVDRVLVDVVEQLHRRPGQAAFGVAHGRRRIAVDRAEIALAVDQRQAHGEILRHAHQRVVDRLVAVRVVFAHHVADHARRLDVFLVGRVPVLVHRIEDAPMHRLEAVARVGKRARHDHAHGVIEIAALHLLGDGDGANVGGAGLVRLLVVGVGQGEILRRSSRKCLADSRSRRQPQIRGPVELFSDGNSVTYRQVRRSFSACREAAAKRRFGTAFAAGLAAEDVGARIRNPGADAKEPMVGRGYCRGAGLPG